LASRAEVRHSISTHNTVIHLYLEYKCSYEGGNLNPMSILKNYNFLQKDGGGFRDRTTNIAGCFHLEKKQRFY
jgi:hypothetical protein